MPKFVGKFHIVKSVQEGQPDRIADLLEEAAREIEELRGRMVYLPAEEYERFIMATEQPPKILPKLQKLLTEPSVFDAIEDKNGK